MQNNIQILCTRPIDDLLLKHAQGKNIDIDILSFIETEPIESVEVQQEVEAVFALAATVIFTSMNAVEAVAEYVIDEQPEWNVYCIGSTTRELVEKYFPFSEIAGTADNAAALAILITEELETGEVIFFCGDQRRDELPDFLKLQGIEVNEIIVYQTIAVPHKIKKDYQGILFFSPSAVESYFLTNKPVSDGIFFAIGNTTAATIKKYTNNKIIIADQPGKEELFEKMIEYFT